MTMTKTSRRGFGKTLTVWSASACGAATAAAQEKEFESKTVAPPCIVNTVLGDFDLPRSTEPAYIFKA